MAVDQIAIEIEKIKESRLGQINFDDLKFGRDFSDHMLISSYENGAWGAPKIIPFQNLPFSPAASVFHYGQAIFEGQKAHRSENGEVLLFRPDQNFERFNRSAKRMCMPEVPEHIYMEGIKALVNLDRDWIPSGEGKSLYIRPFMLADDGFLGVKASESYKFMVITSPTSNYYKGAVSVRIETNYARACQGGIGAAKAAANYAASLLPAQEAKKAGYDQLIWTDAKEHAYIEESGTMNIMMRIGDTLITPSLESNTILPGITRKSILFLAKEWGFNLEERRVKVAEVIDALKSNQLTEAFGMGTAATIAPISKIAYEGTDYELSDYNSWEFANKVKNYLEGLKRGTQADEFGWTVKL